MPSSPPIVETCEFPSLSVMQPGFVRAAHFKDSYRVALAAKDASVVEIFLGIFAHRPAWMNIVMVARNQLAALCGLEVPSASEILSPEIRHRYAVGDKIGAWPIFVLSESELIAGRDNKHLDFRLSVLRVTESGHARAVVSTACRVHNGFGRVYLFFVVPFHKWGVRRLIAAAATAGRL